MFLLFILLKNIVIDTNVMYNKEQIDNGKGLSLLNILKQFTEILLSHTVIR